MKKDLAIALVLVVAGVTLTAACSSSSKDKDSKDGGPGTGGAAGVGGGSGGSGGAIPDGGGAGGTSGASGASGSAGTGGAGGACADTEEPCTQNGNCCGFAAGDNICVMTGDPTLGTTCLDTCMIDDDCETCCEPLEEGAGACIPEGLCACSTDPCTENGDCCGFASGRNVCVDTGPGGIGVACLVVCTAGSECVSGCCAALDEGTTRVCAPASACQ